MTSPRVSGPSLPHGLGRFAQEQAEKSGDILVFMGYPIKNWINCWQIWIRYTFSMEKN
jgi:hypothetical protein